MGVSKWLRFDAFSSERHVRFPDGNQNWWQLAAIQLTGFTSLPILASSVFIIQESNWLSAILTLIAGNLILWAFRLGIVCMSYEGRKSVLDISHEYLGRTSAYLIGVLLLAATLAWFVVETTLASDALCRLIPIDEGGEINQFFQVGVLLGILSTLICMDGMVVLRWFATLCLPILFIAFLGVIFTSDYGIPPSANSSITLAGLPIFLATNLGVTADLPTFFRHSRSLHTSLTALTAIQIISFVIGLGGLFLGSIIVPWSGVAQTDFHTVSAALKGCLIVLVFFSVISSNVSSVYSASVGWELLAPVFAGMKEYLIIGLSSTIIFVLAANVFSLDFLEAATGCALVNLSLVLVLGYLIRLKLKKPPTLTEQRIYFIAWLLSSVFNIFQIIKWDDDFSTFLIGLSVIIIVLITGFSLEFVISKVRRFAR